MVITGRRCLKNGTCNFGEGISRKGVRGIGEMEEEKKGFPLQPFPKKRRRRRRSRTSYIKFRQKFVTYLTKLLTLNSNLSYN